MHMLSYNIRSRHCQGYGAAAAVYPVSDLRDYVSRYYICIREKVSRDAWHVMDDFLKTSELCSRTNFCSAHVWLYYTGLSEFK